MRKIILKSLYLIISVAAVSLACQLNVGGPTSQGTVIPVSEDAAEEVQNTIQSVIDLASSGDAVTFGLSEGQATSLLSLELQKQDNPILSDPQVYFEDGFTEIYGQAENGFLAGNLHLSLEVAVDPEGNPAFNISEANFGPLPLPEGLLEGVSGLLDEAFTGRLGPLATGIRIEKISIDNGWMEISGHLR
jgi:hypothetical protein